MESLIIIERKGFVLIECHESGHQFNAYTFNQP